MHGTVGYVLGHVVSWFLLLYCMVELWTLLSLNSPSLEESGHDRQHSGQ